MKRSAVVFLHIGYWIVYLFLIMCIVGMLLHNSGKAPKLISVTSWFPILFYSYVTIFAILPGLLGFYFFYTVLFSRFLKRKKIIGLFIFGMLESIVSGVLTILALDYLWNPKLFVVNGWPSILAMILFLSVLTFVHGMIGLVLRGFITSYGDIQLKEDLNKKNYEMELALVKSQINPHFLFNTINNIDILIEKDAVKASEYLNKLSGIMRFMLYEAKTEKIPLAKELTYIEKYIDLQKIRTANPNYVNYTVEGDLNDLLVEPMLFIPFIENAFKHAENKKIENAINIRIAIEKDRIIFVCENHYSKSSRDGEGQNGLGNGLIRKRLQLLYPGKHELEITVENEIYKAKLILINDNQLHHSRG